MRGFEKRAEYNEAGSKKQCYVIIMMIIMMFFAAGCSDTSTNAKTNTCENTEQVEETTTNEMNSAYPQIPSDEEIDDALVQDAEEAYKDYIDSVMDPGDYHVFPYF